MADMTRMSDGCVTLDTKAFDAVSDVREKLIHDYNQINEDYISIVETLLSNWAGYGADAFKKDAIKVKENISGIADILQTMCDTLADCRLVFAEADKGMGEYNAAPFSE
jgi:uncharacterized protein YukE